MSPAVRVHRVPSAAHRLLEQPVLQVSGLAARPADLVPEDLTSLPRFDLHESFSCDADRAAAGQSWRGVRISDVTALAQPLADARFVRVRSGASPYPSPSKEPSRPSLAIRSTVSHSPLNAARHGGWSFRVGATSPASSGSVSSSRRPSPAGIPASFSSARGKVAIPKRIADLAALRRESRIQNTNIGRSGSPPDPLLAVDWEDHWRQLVRRRATRFGGHEWNQFDRIARNYAAAVAQQPDRLLDVLEPFLNPTKTLIDVGAGSGRHVVPLAPRLKHVIAVEPSSGMRSLIPAIDNVTVVAAVWLSADVPPADLVLSSHVLYAIDEPVPFIRKLEASARERIFIYLHDSQPVHPSMPLAEALAGVQTPRMPQLSDLDLLLRQIGAAPEVVLWPKRWVQRFPDLDGAAAACRERMGDRWDDRRGRAWLTEHLVSAADGTLTFTDPLSVVGVVHWRPSAEGTIDRG
jgi:hypothetical protein